jgi:hypothetical protein
MPLFRIAFLLSIVPNWGHAESVEPFSDNVRPLLQQYCFDCHGLKKTKGKLNLVQFEEASELGLHDRLWTKVIEQLETNEMPPEDEPELPEKTRGELLAFLKKQLADVEGTQGSFQ